MLLTNCQKYLEFTPFLTFSMKNRSALAAVSLCSLLLSELPISGLPLPAQESLLPIIKTAVAQSCTTTVSLGSAFNTPNSFDSTNTPSGSSHALRPSGGTFNCPTGQIVTSIAYLGIEAGNDSTDGLTIACSTLNSNGTLGSQGAYMVNSDLTSNSRYPANLVQPTCSSGNAVSTVYFSHITDPSRADAIDGTGIGCNGVSLSGFSTSISDVRQPGDLTSPGGQSIDEISCPPGNVVVGVVYDSFGSTLPADPDATDSVVRLRCAPINPSTTCVSQQCSDGIDNDGDGFTDFPSDPGCSSGSDNDEFNVLAQCSDGIDNDGDGFTDFPSDPGCSSATDNDEFNALTANLSITKSGPSSIAKGGVVSYTLTATNGGPNTASNVTFSDAIPAGLTFNAGGSSGNCVQNGSNILCNNITLINGQSATVTVAFNAPNTFTCGGTIQNQASVSTSTTDPVSSNNTSGIVSTNVTCVQCNDGVDNDGDGFTDFPSDIGCSSATDNDEFNTATADLSITKTGPSTVARGATVTYTMTATNGGPNTATNVTIADPIPAGLTFNAGLSSGNCVQNGGNILCNSITLSNGQSATVTVTFNVPNTFACNGVIQNGSSVSTSATDPNPANNQSAVVNTTVTCVQCSDGVDNDGDGATDFPTDFSCSSALDNDETNPRAQCQDGVENDGDGFTDFPQDPGCVSLQDNDESNAIVADLSIVKTGPSSVARGATVTYTMTATNGGPNTATNVTIADPIPAGLTFNAGLSSGNCVQNGGNILCNSITLSNGQSATVTVTFNVPSTFACNGVIQNQGSVSTSVTDPVSGNNQSGIVSTTVTCAPVTFSISKTDGKTSTVPSDTLTYVISVTNTSTTAATSVSLTDTLPANVTFVSASGGTLAGNIVSFVIPAINAGQTVTRTVVVTVNAGTLNGTVLTNTANVTGAQAQDATTVFVAVNQADLFVVKSAVSSIQRGSTLLYTVTATNLGPDTATNVTIADQVPAGLTFNAGASDASCVQNGVNILCNNLTLTSGQSVTRIIAFNVPVTYTCGGTIVNQASVSTSATDPNPNNNQSNVVATSVTCPPVTFSISKTDSKVVAAAGETLNYVITVTNTSVVNASNVIVTDTLPNNVTFVSASGGTLAGNIVTFVIPAMNAGQTVTRTVVVTVNAGTANGTVLTNTANVTGAQAQDITTVQASAAQADLSIVKTGPVGGTVARGGIISYSLTATNNGPSTATNVTIADAIPTGLTFAPASSSSSCIQNGSNILCNSITLTNGQSATVTVAFNVPSTAACNAIIQNQASVSTSATDPNPGNNQSSIVSTTVTCPADMSIVMSVPASVQRGQTLAYSITVNNIGGSTANNVQVIDPPTPAGNATFNVGLSTAGCTQSGSQVICNAGTIVAGGTASFTVVYNILQTTPCTTLTLQNTATVTTSSADSNGSNNSATVSTSVTCPPVSFSMTKTDNKTTAVQGETLSYVIGVTNTSSVNATNVTITDTLPANITFVSASGGTLAGNIVTFVIPSIAASQTINRMVVVTVNAGTINGTVITNTANVTGAQAQDTTTVQNAATFSLTKTDSKTTAVAGETLSYVIGITNTSTVAATNVTLTDTLPSNTSFVSASGGTLNGTVVTFVIPSIAAGQTVNRTVAVTVNAGVANGTVITNTASIGTVTAQDATTVQTGAVTLTLDLSDSTDPIDAGQSYIYTVRLTNTSSTQATGVTVQHLLDGDTEFLAASNNGTHSNGLITWTGVTVPANGTTSLTTTVRARAGVRGGEVLNSTAISGSVSDAETTLVRDDNESSGGTSITLTVRDSADPVEVDECFDEIITIRNNRGISERIDVTGFMDPDMEFRDAELGGRQIGNGRIEWQDITIDANSIETLRATVCVNANSFDGRTLQFRARAQGSEDTEHTRVIGGGILLPPPIGSLPPFGGESIVTVDKSADRQEAQAGSVILYTVTIRNEGQTSTEDLVVEDSFTAGTVSVEDAGGGVMTGNGVTWTGVRIGANSTRVLQYRVRVGANMRHGEVIGNTVTVRGGLTVVTDTENVRILSTLPQTGGSGFLRGDTTAHLRPRIATEDSLPLANLPMMIWTQILALGLAAGGMIGRRLAGW